MSIVSLGDANASRLQKLTAGLPGAQTLRDVLGTYEGHGKSVRDKLLVTYAQLSDVPDSAWEETEDCMTLMERVAGVLNGRGDEEGDKPDRLAFEAALACLHVLGARSRAGLPNKIAAHVSAFTDTRNSWTTQEAQGFATSIIDGRVTEDGLNEFVVEGILKGWIRPVFSKSTTRVTASGRPAHFPMSDDRSNRGLEPPAWKADGSRLIPAFRWAVGASDEALIHEHWPLFMPILLTISEDDETRTRISGLEIMSEFLDKCPAKILQSTGIGRVIQDAIFPSLLFLPSLTPEEESIRIMKPAYRALFTIAEKEQDKSSHTRRDLLDSIIREGILTAYDHASNYISVVETLLETLATAVNCLGIYAVKHLETILSTISSVMTDPFAVLHPPAILEATKALEAVMCNCWPRIYQGYAEEAARIIATCWLNLQTGEVDGQTLKKLQKELKISGSMLQSIQQARGEKQVPRLAEMLEAEPKLGALFSEPLTGA